MVIDGVDLTVVAGAASACVGIAYCVWYLATLRRATGTARVEHLPDVQYPRRQSRGPR